MTRIMAPTTNHTPVVGSRISSLVDDLVEDVFRPSPWTGFDLGSTDIYELEGTLWIETDLPGLRREDVQVRIKDNQLIVRGTYHQEREIPEENFLYKGRPTGQFEMTFPLPREIEEADQITARFEDGILKVGVPLSESIVDTGVEIDVQ